MLTLLPQSKEQKVRNVIPSNKSHISSVNLQSKWQFNDNVIPVALLRCIPYFPLQGRFIYIINNGSHLSHSNCLLLNCIYIPKRYFILVLSQPAPKPFNLYVPLISFISKTYKQNYIPFWYFIWIPVSLTPGSNCQ